MTEKNNEKTIETLKKLLETSLCNQKNLEEIIFNFKKV